VSRIDDVFLITIDRKKSLN